MPADSGEAPAAPAEAEVLPNEALLASAPVSDKKKKRVSLHWNRPKCHLYEYNYDYGSNYYKGMIDYLDKRSSGYRLSPPKAQSWAERALKTYTEKREARGKGNGNDPDVQLLYNIRSNVRKYTVHSKLWNRKVTSHMTYN